MAIKNKIDKVPVVRLNARRGTETPGARPAKRMTVNLPREQRETRLLDFVHNTFRPVFIDT